MNTTISIPGDENLFQLYIPEEVTFKTEDPNITMERKKGELLVHISSANEKNIKRAEKSLQTIALIHKKTIAL